MRFSNERGSLLIAGLWVMVMFSVMSSSLIFNASQQILILKREMTDIQARTDFISALNLAGQIVAGDSQPHEDSRYDAWYGLLSLPEPYKKRMQIRVEDEESKINLNEAPEGLLKIFFKRFERDVSPLNGSPKEYVKAIVKLRSVKRIAVIEELLIADGFDKDDFVALKPYLTVYPDSGLINVNTVSPIVLMTLLDYLSGDTGAKMLFMQRLQEACKVTGDALNGAQLTSCNFLSVDLRPDILSGRLKLPRTPIMMSLVQEFLTAVTVDSETYSINVNLADGHHAWGVFRYRVGQIRPEVLMWNEE